jgi:autoinducer 2-degrading protein
MYLVLVQVVVRPDRLAEFERVLLHNASESVSRDPGCLRFEISQHVDDPTRWVLYELYDSREAHAAHRQSPHFLAYDALARDAVVEKTVSRCIVKNAPATASRATGAAT